MGNPTASLSALIISHYERHAREWSADREGLPWREKPWFERLVRRLQAGSTVLDLGCGSGVPVASYLIGQGMRLTGVDSSATMISICRSRFPSSDWIIADMRALSLDRTFNAVIAWDSFFHLNQDDQRRMFPVFGAHTASNGYLLFNGGPHQGEAIGDYRGDPLYHASLDPAEYEALLAENGFEILEHVVEDRKDAGGRTAWLARKI